MENSSKKRISLLLLLIGIVILGYIASFIFESPKNGITLSFFSVGQGDATLIQTPEGQNVLIDGGPNNTVVSKLDKTIPFYKRKIDAIILTHPHADHLTGLIKVVDTYDVRAFYMTGVTHNTPEYSELLKKLIEYKVPTKIVAKGDKLDFDNGITLSFLFPLTSLEGKTAENLNNTSIVARLVWGESSALFTGDLEKDKLSTLPAEEIKSDVLKVPHHCSANATTKSFVDLVSPKYAVIPVGENNSFGHPAPSCLNALKGTLTYRTDEDGDVVFTMTKDTITPSKLK